MAKLLKPVLLFLLLPACLSFAGCSTGKADASQTKASQAPDPSNASYLVIAKMPSPPVCKKTANAAVLEQIDRLIDAAEKSETGTGVQPGGWNVLLRYPDGRQITLAGDTLTMDEKGYTVSPDLEAEILELYSKLDAAEQPYA